MAELDSGIDTDITMVDIGETENRPAIHKRQLSITPEKNESKKKQKNSHDNNANASVLSEPNSSVEYHTDPDEFDSPAKTNVENFIKTGPDTAQS